MSLESARVLAELLRGRRVLVASFAPSCDIYGKDELAVAAADDLDALLAVAVAAQALLDAQNASHPSGAGWGGDEADAWYLDALAAEAAAVNALRTSLGLLEGTEK